MEQVTHANHRRTMDGRLPTFDLVLAWPENKDGRAQKSRAAARATANALSRPMSYCSGAVDSQLKSSEPEGGCTQPAAHYKKKNSRGKGNHAKEGGNNGSAPIPGRLPPPDPPPTGRSSPPPPPFSGGRFTKGAGGPVHKAQDFFFGRPSGRLAARSVCERELPPCHLAPRAIQPPCPPPPISNPLGPLLPPIRLLFQGPPLPPGCPPTPVRCFPSLEVSFK